MNGQTWEMSGYFLKKRRIFDEIKYYILSIISICSGIFISNVSVISKEQRQERDILTLLMFTMGLLFIMLNAGWFDISNIIGKKEDKKRMKFLKKINFFSLPAQQNNIRNELITSDIENKK